MCVGKPTSLAGYSSRQQIKTFIKSGKITLTSNGLCRASGRIRLPHDPHGLSARAHAHSYLNTRRQADEKAVLPILISVLFTVVESASGLKKGAGIHTALRHPTYKTNLNLVSDLGSETS